MFCAITIIVPQSVASSSIVIAEFNIGYIQISLPRETLEPVGLLLAANLAYRRLNDEISGFGSSNKKTQIL